jgi:hypothetical protein
MCAATIAQCLIMAMNVSLPERAGTAGLEGDLNGSMQHIG